MGLSPHREAWGTRPPDLGLWRCFNLPTEDWTVVPPESGNTRLAVYSVPRVRVLWGEKQSEVHRGGQELFLDLIFVGLAYRVGQCLKSSFYDCMPPYDDAGRLLGSTGAAEPEIACITLTLSLVHSLAPFVCMYTLWDLEKRHRAQFATASAVHSVLDLANDLALILAAMNVQPANAYRTVRDPSTGLARVLVPTLVSLGIWMARLWEVALLSAREGARRECAAEGITCIQLTFLWGTAFHLSSAAFGSDDANAVASDASAALMWVGALMYIVKRAMKTFAELLLPGALPLERAAVCANTGFAIHRNNEFMFLMLGETVLQIIVAIAPGDVIPPGTDPIFNVSVGTAAVSFALAVCMMVSFRSMVRGQLEGYGRTNTGLAVQAAETENLFGEVSHGHLHPPDNPQPTSSTPPKGQPDMPKAGSQPNLARPASTDVAPMAGEVSTLSTESMAAASLSGDNSDGTNSADGAADLPPSRDLPTCGSDGDKAIPSDGAAVQRFSQVCFAAASASQDSREPPERRSGAEPVKRVHPGRRDFSRQSTHSAFRSSPIAKKLMDTKPLDASYELKAIRVLLHMRLYNTLNTLLWEVKALSIMLVGVGVKLAIHDPMASPTAHFAVAQRLELGLPLAACFGVQLFHTLTVKTRHHYSLSALREQPAHVLVVAMRIVLLIASVLVCWLPLSPLPMMCVQAAISSAQCVLIFAHDFRFQIKGHRQHPMRELPNALLALQQRRKRAAKDAVRAAERLGRADAAAGRTSSHACGVANV